MTRFPLLYDNTIYIQLPEALEWPKSPIQTILNLRSKSARFSEHPINQILNSPLGPKWADFSQCLVNIFVALTYTSYHSIRKQTLEPNQFLPLHHFLNSSF